MTSFVSAQVTGASDNWSQAVEALVRDLRPLPAGANLGFVYLSGDYAGVAQAISDALVASTGVATWVGTAGLGILSNHGECFNAPGISALVGALPPEGFRVLHQFDGQPLDPALEGWCKTHQAMVAAVHGDPRHPRLPQLITGLADALSSGFLVGGLTSSQGAYPQLAGGPGGDDLSGVIFGGEVGVQVGLSQGCVPLGPRHEITRRDDNVLLELDSRPALEVLEEDLSRLSASERRRLEVFAAFPIPGSDTADYLVRNLLGVSAEHGAVGVAESLEIGTSVMFCRRDPQAAEDDLVRALTQLQGRLSAPPRAGLYYSCLARGPNLFDAPEREVAIIRKCLGDFPWVGFYGNGEICHNRLYAYTGVLSLFC